MPSEQAQLQGNEGRGFWEWPPENSCCHPAEGAPGAGATPQ